MLELEEDIKRKIYNNSKTEAPLKEQLVAFPTIFSRWKPKPISNVDEKLVKCSWRMVAFMLSEYVFHTIRQILAYQTLNRDIINQKS